jgi:hypothetical protein
VVVGDCGCWWLVVIDGGWLMMGDGKW